MRLIRYLLALACAAALHLALLRVSPTMPQVIDEILILVLYHSQASRRGWDILGGATAGMVHDALTGGIYGQLGLVDTVTAFVCARSRQHLVIRRPWRLGLFFALMALFQQTLLAAVRLLLLDGVNLAPLWSVAAKMLTTGMFGAVVFWAAGRLRARRRRRIQPSRTPSLDRRWTQTSKR